MLLGYYLQQKHLGKAKEMLDRMAGDDGYPYGATADLMQAIPKSRAAERTAIFSQALANYRQFNTDLMVDEGDFGGMLLRCWRDLPPEIVLYLAPQKAQACSAALRNLSAASESVFCGFPLTEVRPPSEVRLYIFASRCSLRSGAQFPKAKPLMPS